MGDFNARTGEISDYTPLDEFIVKNVGQDTITSDLLVNDNECYGRRVSNDKGLNTYKHYLLNLCNKSNLRIVNGRYGADSKLAICKGSSVIDYVIVSEDLLPEVLKMSVEPFDPLLSDIHCTISLNVHCTIISNTVNMVNDAEFSDFT